MRPDPLLLIREHVTGEHPLLDVEGCPVCEWMLAQHQQAEVDQ